MGFRGLLVDTYASTVKEDNGGQGISGNRHGGFQRRHVVGRFDGKLISLEEIYRFDNGPVDVAGSLYWDLLAQCNHVTVGMRAAGARYGNRIASVGVDTWGVDFGLLGRGDQLLGNPYHYRDARTSGMMAKAEEFVSREEIFRHSGLQFMQLNTLYQLLAMKLSNSPLLEVAETLLMMPDLFHWLMTGQKCNELTDATTTQFYNPVRGGWATELLEKMHLPTAILGRIVQPGNELAACASLCRGDRPGGCRSCLARQPRYGQCCMAVPAASKPGQKPDCAISAWARAERRRSRPGRSSTTR